MAEATDATPRRGQAVRGVREVRRPPVQVRIRSHDFWYKQASVLLRRGALWYACNIQKDQMGVRHACSRAAFGDAEPSWPGLQ